MIRSKIFLGGIAVFGIFLTAVIAFLLFQRPNSKNIAANKELVQISSKIRQYYQNRPDYRGLNTAEVVKNNLYVGKVSNNVILNSRNKPVLIGGDAAGSIVMPGSRSFVISYLDLTRKECIELSSRFWQETEKLGVLSMSIINNAYNQEFNWGEGGLPLNTSQAEKYCKDKNTLVWAFE